MTDQSALPETSAILCSRDRRELLRDCVGSVLAGEQVPTELIIVDDSDEPDPFLAELTTDRPCEIRYDWRHGRGLSSAVNHAIRQARHDLLVFTQDDAVVDETWLETIVRAQLREGPMALISGNVEGGEPESEGAFVSAMTTETGPATYTEPQDRDVLYCLNMAMYRSAFDAIGPFDERLGPGTTYPASEDSDFAYRAFRTGYRIVHEPAAIVRHRAWRGEEMHARFRYGYGFARGGFYGKFIRRRDRYMTRRLWHDVRNHLTPLPRLVRTDREQAVGHLSLAAGLVAGTARWLVSERGPDPR
jgi:GT2 family glycosyltransferase